ncbi:MAG: hypothetical protein DMF11_12925 [Verrucomicrobia bacterium]|nr:MAG: hypothetical protein DMF11_12925 [Verrucomicrobiota bacterium]
MTLAAGCAFGAASVQDVGVGVGVGVNVAVAVAVAVAVLVAVAVAVAVGAGVGETPGQTYVTFKPVVSAAVPQEKVVTGPAPLACTPLVALIPSLPVTP